MNWTSTLFPKHWRVINLVTIALVSTLLIVASASVGRFVSQVTLSTFYNPFFLVRAKTMELSMAADLNQSLRASLAAVTMRLSMSDEAVRENRRLRKQIGFEPPTGYALIPTRVISVSGKNYSIAAIINRGAHDSVKVDQPVINQQGLIGRIVSVSDDFSQVQLLTDPTNRVAARIATSREMGIVKCLASGTMILDNFPIQGTIIVGDTIISSGLGGIYPPGLVVGTVADVNRPEEEPFADVILSPAANFWSIEELFILRPEDR